MSREKRTFSRIETRIKAYARKSADPYSTGLYQPPSVPSSLVPHGSKLPEGVGIYLEEMNRKLDTVLSLLSRNLMREDFPLDLEVLELSGAGMRFRSAERFQPGQAMEVVLELERMPLNLAGAKGIVLEPDTASGLFRFEFSKIGEIDLENIIQFVFKKQREQIRDARRG